MAKTTRMTLRYVLAFALIVILAGSIIYAPQYARNVAYGITSGQLQAEREDLAQMAAKSDTLSPLFRKVAKVVMPAVVEVRVTKRVAVPQMPDLGDLFGNDPFFRQFGDQFRQRGPVERQMKGLGSGAIVDAANGYVLTNNHVVGGADEVEVITSDNRHLEAEWVKTDPATDLAIVKVKGDNLTSAPLGDSDAMQVGDVVLAIGSPEQLPQTVTMGIISAKGRNQAGLGGSGNLYQNFLQTDAAINHGNSGGPLVNMKGEIIGVNTAIVSRTGVNEGIGLSIPSNMVKQVMNQLIAKGKVVRGYLGASLQEVNSNLAKSFNLPSTEGALVNGFGKDSPGEKAGLQNGDFITAVDGKKVTDVSSLRMAIAAIEPGKTVKLELYRGGKKLELSVKIGEQPKDISAAFTGQPSRQNGHANASKFGIKVTALTPNLAAQLGYKEGAAGAIISEIDPSSSAADQGVKVGMLVVKVGDKAVRTPEDFAVAVSAKEAASGVRLELTTPNGQSQFVFLTPTKPHKPLAPAPEVPEEGQD